MDSRALQRMHDVLMRCQQYECVQWHDQTTEHCARCRALLISCKGGTRKARGQKWRDGVLLPCPHSSSDSSNSSGSTVAVAQLCPAQSASCAAAAQRACRASVQPLHSTLLRFSAIYCLSARPLPPSSCS